MLLQRHVASLWKYMFSCPEEWASASATKLRTRISAYEQLVSVIIKLDDETKCVNTGQNDPDINTRAGEVSDDLSDMYLDEWFMPETEWIMLPSALAPGEINCLLLNPIANDQGWAMQGPGDGCSWRTSPCPGEKSLHFRTEVQQCK